MRYSLTIAVIVAATMALFGCATSSDDGMNGNGDGGSNGTGGVDGTGGGNGTGGVNGTGGSSGEPSGEGRYMMMPMTGDPYEITKTVLYHNLSGLGDCCFYSFRHMPDPDEIEPDPDPFYQFIDVFYDNVSCTDDFGFRFVYQNVEYNSSMGTPLRSPAEPSDEPLATGTYFAENGERGDFAFILEQALSQQLPDVSTCLQ